MRVQLKLIKMENKYDSQRDLLLKFGKNYFLNLRVRYAISFEGADSAGAECAQP